MSDQPALSSAGKRGVQIVEPEAAPVFEPYESPAGGWGALRAIERALREQSIVLKGSEALLSMNQPGGFDCPGCAWSHPKRTSSFEFCENGAKAVSSELKKRRVTREFFAARTVSELERQSDYCVEEQGRLTEPMRYNGATDHYEPIGWGDAVDLIGRHLRALESPDSADAHTSGRENGNGPQRPDEQTSSFAPASRKTPRLEISQRWNSQQSGATTSTIRRSTASMIVTAASFAAEWSSS